MKKMRKRNFIILTLAMVMLFNLCACNGGGKSSDEKSLYDQGLDVAAIMSEMIKTETYADMYYPGNDGIKKVIENISKGDYTSPKAVYKISVPDEDFAALEGMEAFNDMPESLRKVTKQKMLNAFASQINSMGGVEILAASSVYVVEKTFVNTEAKEDVIYLYTYENAVPIAVTFTVGEGGAVSADGIFILYEDFSCGSAEEIKPFFKGVNADVSEVSF